MDRLPREARRLFWKLGEALEFETELVPPYGDMAGG
jgi:hypothetical protein